jgi:hypothetical protein
MVEVDDPMNLADRLRSCELQAKLRRINQHGADVTGRCQRDRPERSRPERGRPEGG